MSALDSFVLCRYALAFTSWTLLASPLAVAADPLPRLGPQVPRYEGSRPPWRARKARVATMRPAHQGLIDLSRWPKEPEAPTDPQVKRFAGALRRLCGNLTRKRRRLYARWIIEASRQYGVDPFTVAALIYQQSGCDRRKTGRYGVGLAGIDAHTHARHVRRGRLRYWVLDHQTGSWKRQELKLGRYRFTRSHLRGARGAIFLASALLAAYRQQCPAIDAPFGSVPHRHHVSHLIWGDRVRDAAHEDEVLHARRRIIALYLKQAPSSCGEYAGVALHSPFGGPPLKVLSGWGDGRDRRRRSHKGIDLFAPQGAPVYAVAAGRVAFAGLTWRRGRRKRSKSLPYHRARRIRRSRVGKGGLYVMVRHQAGLYSAYMHLSRYVVLKGQRVRAGQLIGQVGRTGMRSSAPHLHFELRAGHRGHFDPLPQLAACLIPPEETYVGRWRHARELRRRQRRDAQRGSAGQ